MKSCRKAVHNVGLPEPCFVCVCKCPFVRYCKYGYLSCCHVDVFDFESMYYPLPVTAPHQGTSLSDLSNDKIFSILLHGLTFWRRRFASRYQRQLKSLASNRKLATLISHGSRFILLPTLPLVKRCNAWKQQVVAAFVPTSCPSRGDKAFHTHLG